MAVATRDDRRVTAAVAAPDEEIWLPGRRIPEHWWGYVLVAPAVILVMGLILYPVVYSFWLSVHSKHAYLPIETFVGLDNFRYFLTDYDGFWRSLWLGTIYAFGTVTLQLLAGVGAALLLNQTFIGRGFVRGCALFPYMVPMIVVVILMRWILNDGYGILPYALRLVGLDVGLLLGPDWIMLSLILISTWTFFPFILIGTLARLQTIDPELYAAAKVDGAGPLRRFWHITLPQIRAVLFVLVLLRFMFMFTKFDIIWLFASGTGVGYFTRTLPIYTYVKTFQELQVGMGAALSVVIFLILVAFSLLYFRVFRKAQEQ
jgi:multiple sugar transport system permease protein